MSKAPHLTCSFCGKERDSVEKLVAGPGVYICNECVGLSYQIVSEIEPPEKVVHNSLETVPTPREIHAFLNEHIVGHEDAKEMLSASAYNHYKRIYSTSTMELDKSNVMLLGPTGSGKTLFAKTLSKKLDVPFAIADATTLTESGYMGEDADSVLERLLSMADYDVEAAQMGIVYIDEIDKKAKKSTNSNQARDVSGEGVQQALLRMIEGTVTRVKVHNGGKFSQEEFVDFDTTNVLFILGGAFVGIEKQIEKRLKGQSSIGFGAPIIDEQKRRSLLTKVIPEDLIEYGLIPELMGRIPILGVLDLLTEDQLYDILVTVKDNHLAQAKEILLMDNLKLTVSDEFVRGIANEAIKKNMGARALKNILEQILMSVMYRAPDLHKMDVVEIIFDKYPREEKIKPTLVFEDGKKAADTYYKRYRGYDE